MTRFLVAVYLIMAGLLLILAPWSQVWQNNAFLNAVPGLQGLGTNLFFRGGVSGVGVITLLGGVRDLVSMLFARPHTDVPTPADRPWR